MQSVLILDPREDIRREYKKGLRQCGYQVLTCAGAEEGAGLLREHRPQVLILNPYLYGIDGITFLEEIQDLKPDVVITVSIDYPAYMRLRLLELGVGYLLLSPCSIEVITRRVKDMLQKSALPMPPEAGQIVAKHLRILGFSNQLGVRQTVVGVPLFAQDRTQRMTKNLYPAIAKLCGCNNWNQVESDIRDMKKKLWKKRDKKVWDRYFPGVTSCPANHVFISRLADILDEEMAAYEMPEAESHAKNA